MSMSLTMKVGTQGDAKCFQQHRWVGDAVGEEREDRFEWGCIRDALRTHLTLCVCEESLQVGWSFRTINCSGISDPGKTSHRSRGYFTL